MLECLTTDDGDRLYECLKLKEMVLESASGRCFEVDGTGYEARFQR